MCGSVHSEARAWPLGQFLPSTMGSKDWSQFFSFDSNCCSPLRHLTGPWLYLVWQRDNSCVCGGCMWTPGVVSLFLVSHLIFILRIWKCIILCVYGVCELLCAAVSMWRSEVACGSRCFPSAVGCRDGTRVARLPWQALVPAELSHQPCPPDFLRQGLWIQRSLFSACPMLELQLHTAVPSFCVGAGI